MGARGQKPACGEAQAKAFQRVRRILFRQQRDIDAAVLSLIASGHGPVEEDGGPVEEDGDDVGFGGEVGAQGGGYVSVSAVCIVVDLLSRPAADAGEKAGAPTVG